MRCTECGSENREGARFCARCGANLSAPDSLPTATPEAEAPAPQGTELEGADSPLEAPDPSGESDGSEDEGLASELPFAEEPASTPEDVPEEDEGDLNDDVAQVAVEEEDAAISPDEVAQQAPEQAATPTSDEEAGAPAVEPLPAGSRLQGRYEIVELLESGPDGQVYAAYDLGRCSQCGFTDNDPDSGFCADCGATLEAPVRCTIRQTLAEAAPSIADQFSESGFLYTVVLEPEVEDGKGLAMEAVRFAWGQRTDVGRARQVNEDYVDARVYAPHHGPSLGLFVVADGVGGQEHGEVASSLAAEVIWDRIRAGAWEPELRGEPALPEVMQQILRDAVEAANQAVYQLRVKQGSNMGTTVTAALVRNDLAVIANVGDSRTYLWGPDGLQRLTVDHSVVESLVAAGRITRDQVYSHPQRNLIYRSLGDRPAVDVDTFVRELEPGESLLLCSDGLWEMAHDDGIVDVLMREGNPQQACDALVDLANLAGGEDNISAIIVRVDRRE